MIEIGAPAYHKSNMYNNEVCRKKKVGDRRQRDLERRKKENLSLRLNIYI